MNYWLSLFFFPPDQALSAERKETNRSRKEHRQLRMQPTSPEQVCFVAAAQIGALQSRTQQKGKNGGKTWAVITSADPQPWPAQELLHGRREYWGIEGKLHQRLDATLDEDRSRARTVRGMTVLGMFRRLVVSFACAWLDNARRRKQKNSARDFQEHLRAENARRAFSLVTSLEPKAWNAK